MAGASNVSKQKLFYGGFQDAKDQNYAAHTKGRKKQLVLGHRGLLCHRICKKNSSEIPICHRLPNAFYGSYAVYNRPYREEFMKFCRERIEMAIWSSARMVLERLPGLYSKWVDKQDFVYLGGHEDAFYHGEQKLESEFSGNEDDFLFFPNQDQNECTNTGFSSLYKKGKPIFLKELKKVWDRNCSRILQRSDIYSYSASKTLLTDDQPCKGLLNPPHTSIFPTEYKAYNVNDNSLGPNGKLRLCLDGLAAAVHVPSKAHPFG